MTRAEKIEKIADRYGKVHQNAKLVEECAELIQAVLAESDEHVAQEMADVMIMIEQLEYLYDLEPLVEKFIDAKLDRQLRRMEEENNAG